MVAYRLSLIEDNLAPGAALEAPLAARSRALYVAQGAVRANDAHILSDNVWYGFGALSLTAGPEGATAWRFEVLTDGDPVAIAAGAGVASSEKLTSALEPVSPGPGWLLRLDAVAFPPGACAYRHTHPGPGIRCLIEGSIRIDTDHGSAHFGPGEAWYEAGPEPVFAQADAEVPSRFIRVLIIPPEFKGKRTVQYVDPQDNDKPRLQTNRVYCETLFGA